MDILRMFIIVVLITLIVIVIMKFINKKKSLKLKTSSAVKAQIQEDFPEPNSRKNNDYNYIKYHDSSISDCNSATVERDMTFTGIDVSYSEPRSNVSSISNISLSNYSSKNSNSSYHNCSSSDSSSSSSGD